MHSGRLTETISNTHKSADFIAFLKKLEEAYPAPQKIRLLLDNHSAHISRETRDYLDSVPQRFVFVFMPTHGSWLNLVENLFSKMTRSMLRGIRVATKQELVDRIHQYFGECHSSFLLSRNKITLHWLRFLRITRTQYWKEREGRKYHRRRSESTNPGSTRTPRHLFCIFLSSRRVGSGDRAGSLNHHLDESALAISKGRPPALEQPKYVTRQLLYFLSAIKLSHISDSA